MSVRCDPDETIVVDPAESIDVVGHLRPHSRGDHRDDAAGLLIGKGTRDQAAVVASGPTGRNPPASRSLAAGSQPIERPRDPAEVLRMWPASVSPAPPRPPRNRRIDERSESGGRDPAGLAGGTRATGRRGIDDKVELAHLALELYRELGQIATEECASHELSACTNQACEARVNALRGGLVEACLLVQRVVMMSPTTSGVEADVRELLALLDD